MVSGLHRLSDAGTRWVRARGISRSRAPDQRGFGDAPVAGAFDAHGEVRGELALALGYATDQGRGYAEDAGGLCDTA